MIRTILRSAALLMSAAPGLAMAQQAPWNAKDMPVSHRDRVYASEQFSNTVSVTDPADNRLLGVIKLGDPQPMNFSPLYKGQVLVHGLGFSPDGKTLAVVSIGSNAVSWIDTATNTVKHTTYVGRSPHEAFFTPDGKEVWVTVRGEDYIAVLDPFCPNIAATPDGKQVWFTLKDIGKTVAFDARPPFAILKVLDTGPITNHVNFARTAKGQFAYVTVGGENVVKVFRTSDFTPVATIPVGKMPHGVWPSGDGRRVYVGLENSDELAAIDTAGNTVVATVPVGQAPQAIAYVSNAVPTGPGTDNLQPLGTAGKALHLTMGPIGGKGTASSITLFDQGIIQVVQSAVTGLQPKKPYMLVLTANADGSGAVEPLANFMSNPAGAAIVNASGPIRQIVQGSTATPRRFLAVAEVVNGAPGRIVQVQRD